jgi:hypothetical protein
MRLINYLFFTILFVTTCSISSNVTQEKTLVGVFIGSESKERITLDSNHKFIIMAPQGSLFDDLNKIDTISYGTWNIDKEFLVLNSAKEILGQFLHLCVKEAYVTQDSITVEITNPYEEELTKRIVAANNKAFYKTRPFYYVVNFTGNNVGFVSKSGTIRGGNIIKYQGYNDLKISSISITIIPDNFNYPGYLSYKLVYTLPYETMNPNSNYFKINIPDFTSNYMNYRRLKGEFVKILGRDKLQWNNEIYIRDK